MARPLRIDVPATKLQLEARWTGEGPLAIVAPPHPAYGGTIGNPVVKAIEAALQRAQLATLAFNFRGTGDSDGTQTGDLEEARVDYRAVVEAYPPVLLSGYSYGSVTALAVAVERNVPRVLMVAPPFGILDRELLAKYSGELLVIIGDQDEYTPVTAIEDFFIARPNTRVELLRETDHWFLGSAIHDLSAGLHRLLA